MSITVTFDPPLPSDSPSTFNTKAFTLLGDLNDWSTEANALASTVNSNASTSATNASNASNSADAAATSASNTAAIYDAFDDRYLGAKAVAPTLDNDGGALLTGALYFNTASNTMFVYTGSSWVATNASFAAPGPIGGTTPAAGTFTTLTSTGNAALGDAEASDTHAIKGATTLLANSANAALTVTQTGAGNAFVVEDSASPDSTPFVIDANGRVGIGITTPGVAVQVQNNTQAALYLDTGPNNSQISFRRYNTSISSPSVVASGNDLGLIDFSGYDGATQIVAARITASVDGTPGPSDMPGRLIFSTTADGASTPTERMRIDSAGNVGIGGTAPANIGFYVTKAITGSTFSDAISIASAAASDVTGGFRGVQSRATTAAASFTLSNLYHFYANPPTFGAGSSVTHQYGFFAESTLTGATNNYGFYSNIASGSNRYNFYAAGTAQSYFGGNLTITSSQNYAAANLVVNGSPSMNTSAIMGIANNVTLVGGASTTQYRAFSNETTYTPAASGGTGFGMLNTTQHNNGNPVATHYQNYSRTDLSSLQLGGTISTIVQYGAISPIFHASATTNVTTYHGFKADNVVQGAAQTVTNIYGFYSNQTAGTNRYNFYAAGTADNVFVGAVGIGITPSAGLSLRVARAATGNTSAQGVYVDPTIQSDVLTDFTNFYSSPSTVAAAFTLPGMYHFRAIQGSIGAGSAVTNQRGFDATSTLTGATNNYGFYSNITSAANRYNFYAAGSANNAFAGASSFGKVTAPTSAVDTTSLATGYSTSSGATCTVESTDHTIIQTTTGSTYTLPAAASFPGRRLHLVTQFAGAVISASSNVVPIAGGAAGTAILAATAGKFAILQSNGTNWVIVASN